MTVLSIASLVPALAPVPRCDVCERDLSPRGRQVTGLCYQCLQEGARFSHAWMADLKERGYTSAQIARMVGCSAATVRARLRDLRLGAA